MIVFLPWAVLGVPKSFAQNGAALCCFCSSTCLTSSVVNAGWLSSRQISTYSLWRRSAGSQVLVCCFSHQVRASFCFGYNILLGLGKHTLQELDKLCRRTVKSFYTRVTSTLMHGCHSTWEKTVNEAGWQRREKGYSTWIVEVSGSLCLVHDLRNAELNPLLPLPSPPLINNMHLCRA